jgi:hypothetical protein
MARSASPGVVAGIVRHPGGGKQVWDNIEFLKDAEVILI